MATPEGSNIGTNVRQNNNIVWRNLNVVDLESDADSKVVMNIRGAVARKASQIVFEETTRFPRPRFTDTGEVLITVDRALLRHWQASGGKSTGLRAIDGGAFEMTADRASLDDVVLPRDYRGQITVIFRKADQTPRTRFDFSVKHYAGDSRQGALLGGVDYELARRRARR
jgi:hypothetical protein